MVLCLVPAPGQKMILGWSSKVWWPEVRKTSCFLVFQSTTEWASIGDGGGGGDGLFRILRSFISILLSDTSTWHFSSTLDDVATTEWWNVCRHERIWVSVRSSPRSLFSQMCQTGCCRFTDFLAGCELGGHRTEVDNCTPAWWSEHTARRAAADL